MTFLSLGLSVTSGDTVSTKKSRSLSDNLEPFKFNTDILYRSFSLEVILFIRLVVLPCGTENRVQSQKVLYVVAPLDVKSRLSPL